MKFQLETMKGPVVQMYSNKELERVSGKIALGLTSGKTHH